MIFVIDDSALATYFSTSALHKTHIAAMGAARVCSVRMQGSPNRIRVKAFMLSLAFIYGECPSSYPIVASLFNTDTKRFFCF
jgi:hypothetical protein